MPFPALRITLVFVGAANAYILALMITAAIRRGAFLGGSGFSSRKYYLLMGWAPLAFGALALMVNPRYLLLFVVAGVAGVLGELLVSLLWRGFFHQPIWTYSHRSVLRGYTSTINFLPWAVGAFLFHVLGRLVTGGSPAATPTLLPVAVSSAAFVIGCAVAWPGRVTTSAREGRFTPRAFAVFCLPIAFTALALSLFCGPRYLLLMLVFAPVGFFTEYVYGRSMSLFFDPALWAYNHWRIDGGHTSFVTLPLWSLGGLYLWFISNWIGL
ncbi:MAG: hypothetical protein HY906_20110 [Deltaproteobacteria bacterium]|nr:hypothetical protein [Deltaproteobacteria bacterium]